MKAVWASSFSAFAGPGIDHPSQLMRVTDDEATAILVKLEAMEWQSEPISISASHRTFGVCNALASWTTALFHGDGIIGFYFSSYLWIAKSYRGAGLSGPLILAAALHRGGTALPPGIVCQGYTAAGLAAHRAAYRQAFLMHKPAAASLDPATAMPQFPTRLGLGG